MQTKKLKYLLLFAVIAIAAAVAWYFAYWVKTPQYSLGLIGSAVQKHDFAAFEKHVDMETLYSSAYDDVVVASFGNERLSSPDSGCVSTEYQRCCRPDPDRPDQTIRQRRYYGRSRSK